jgi:hypothetical protein
MPISKAETAFMNLRDRLFKLNEEISDLTTRLSPVCNPNQPEKCVDSKGEPKVVQSPIVNHLYDTCEIVETMIDHVIRLRNSIEV